MAIDQKYFLILFGPRIIMETAERYFLFDCGPRIIIPIGHNCFQREDDQGNGLEFYFANRLESILIRFKFAEPQNNYFQ